MFLFLKHLSLYLKYCLLILNNCNLISYNFSLFFCLSIFLSAYLFVSLSICPIDCLFVWLSACLFSFFFVRQLLRYYVLVCVCKNPTCTFWHRLGAAWLAILARRRDTAWARGEYICRAHCRRRWWRLWWGWRWAGPASCSGRWWSRRSGQRSTGSWRILKLNLIITKQIKIHIVQKVECKGIRKKS